MLMPPPPGRASPAPQYIVTEHLQYASTEPPALSRGASELFPTVTFNRTGGEGGASRPKAPRPPAKADTQRNYIKENWSVAKPSVAL